MKKFTTFLFERVQLRARKHMPQIDKMDEFLEDLKSDGYKIKYSDMNPKDLKPTQTEFNEEKVKSMIQAGSYKNKPIVVTDDNYILDGHHRWKAHLDQKEDQPVIKVNMNFDDLFDYVDGKKYVKYKEIHEMKLNDWYDSNMSMSDFMTDEEKEEITKNKVDDIYKKFFTPETFDKIYKSMNEEGAISGVGGMAGGGVDPSQVQTTVDPSLNGVAGVDLPPTNSLGKVKRRKRKQIDEWSADIDDYYYDSDGGDGGDGGGDGGD